MTNKNRDCIEILKVSLYGNNAKEKNKEERINLKMTLLRYLNYLLRVSEMLREIEGGVSYPTVIEEAALLQNKVILLSEYLLYITPILYLCKHIELQQFSS